MSKDLIRKLKDIEDEWKFHGINSLSQKDIDAIRDARYLIQRICDSLCVSKHTNMSGVITTCHGSIGSVGFVIKSNIGQEKNMKNPKDCKDCKEFKITERDGEPTPICIIYPKCVGMIHNNSSLIRQSEWEDLGNHGDLDDLNDEWDDYFPGGL